MKLRCQNLISHLGQPFFGSAADEGHRGQAFGEACPLALWICCGVFADSVHKRDRIYRCLCLEEDNALDWKPNRRKKVPRCRFANVLQLLLDLILNARFHVAASIVCLDLCGWQLVCVQELRVLIRISTINQRK